MTAILSPPLIFQGVGFGGEPLPFGYLYSYIAGTATPQATWTDSTQVQQNLNPVKLNVNGQAPLWLDPGLTYKFKLTDALGNQVYTTDQVQGSLTAAALSALLPALLAAIITQSYIGALLYPQTAAEIAAVVTPTALQYPEGDIRRYGALTSNVDNSTAFNSALLVSSNGGNAAFIPGGNWNVTSSLIANSLSLAGSSSMYGTGQGSVIVAHGCDGLSFLSGQVADEGARFFRDFVISGSSSTSSVNNGITINLVTGKIIGVQFSNLVIQNFQKAVSINGANGLWNSAFVDCFLFNNYNGYYIFGQAVVLNIRGGFIIGGLTMTGSGTRYGLFSQDNAGGNLQSLHMQGVAFYNYDYLIYIINPVYIAIENCDLSIYNICGVFIGGRGGGFSVRDCWIQAATGINNCAGVFVQDLGTAQFDKIVIDGNTLEGTTGTGSCGVYLGSNAGPVSVTNNIIGSSITPFVIGVGGTTPGALGVSAVGGAGAFSEGSVIENNTIYATNTAVLIQSLITNISVRDNITQNGTPIAFTNAAVTPVGFSYSAPGMKGTVVFAATTSATVTFPSPMPSGAYFVSLGGNASGFVWPVNKTVNGFIIDCSASNSTATDWSISYQ